VNDLRAMARGETVEIAGTERGDEISQTANAVNALR
jgi:methyl-accepting chemotaxis protein